MTDASLDVAQEGGSVVIRVSGEIDVGNADAVEGELKRAVDSRVDDVVIDLTRIDYLDSAGVRVMFVLAGRLQMRQIALRVIAAPGSTARRVLEIAGYRALASDLPS